MCGEVFGADGDEHCIGGEAGDPTLTSACRRDVQRPSFTRGDVGSNPVGLMQRHRPQILHRQAASHRRGAGDPQCEAQDVIARGRHGSAMGQAWSPDVALVERHIGVHRVAAAVHHQTQSVGIVRAATHARRCVRR